MHERALASEPASAEAQTQLALTLLRRVFSGTSCTKPPISPVCARPGCRRSEALPPSLAGALRVLVVTAAPPTVNVVNHS
jgi:hypothetical protein